MINELAPIAQLVADWQHSGYSQQTLRRMLTTRLDAARWHARYGVRCWRPIQWANVQYLEWVLDAMETRVAA